jgi:hypothetical protein
MNMTVVACVGNVLATGTMAVFADYGIQKLPQVFSAFRARVWCSGHSVLWGADVQAKAEESVDEWEHVSQELLCVLFLVDGENDRIALAQGMPVWRLSVVHKWL